MHGPKATCSSGSAPANVGWARSLLVALALVAVACEEPPASDPVARGEQVYRKLDCGRCHQIAGRGARLGPELTRIGEIAATRKLGATAEEYLRGSIDQPGAYIVPGYADVMPRALTRGLSEFDRDALIAYLLSLK